MAYKTATILDPDDATGHFNLGYTLFKLGRNTEGLIAYKTATILDPDDANLHFNLGYVLWKLGHYTEATAAYKTGVRLDPDSPRGRKVVEFLAR